MGVEDHALGRSWLGRTTPANGWWSRQGKRLIDVIGGSVISLAMTPVLVAFAAVLAIQLRTWPFFVHRRVGTRGRLLAFPKLRTLSAHTPRYADKTEVELQPPSSFARWLRDSHLDELPQLYLVPIGRLSLVGPRARMPQEVLSTDETWNAIRVQVRQGCTGLWQVGEHTEGTVSDSPEYDVFYLRFGSLRLDLWILWRTVVQLLSGHGVGLDRVPRWTIGRGYFSGDDRADEQADMQSVNGDRVSVSSRPYEMHASSIGGGAG